MTRADGEHGEGGESSLELGIAVFAVAEPAKLYLKDCYCYRIYYIEAESCDIIAETRAGICRSFT